MCTTACLSGIPVLSSTRLCSRRRRLSSMTAGNVSLCVRFLHMCHTATPTATQPTGADSLVMTHHLPTPSSTPRHHSLSLLPFSPPQFLLFSALFLLFPYPPLFSLSSILSSSPHPDFFVFIEPPLCVTLFPILLPLFSSSFPSMLFFLCCSYLHSSHFLLLLNLTHLFSFICSHPILVCSQLTHLSLVFAFFFS